MRKIKIAQIGTSVFSHGLSVFDSLKKNSDIFEVVGYALPEKEREKFPDKIAWFDGYKEMTVEEILSDPQIEAVAIETEEIYLTKYALMAAKAKKHIHMEKPGGLSLSDFTQLINTVKANKTVFHTGYMYRYNPAIINLLKRIDRGELGDIISVEAQMSCYHRPDCREWMNTFGSGGMLFFLGCHLIDLIYRICGKPENIIPFTRSSGADGINSPDFGMAVYEYKNGVSFAKTTDCERGGFMRRQLVVTGTKETVEVKPLEVACGATSNYTEYRITNSTDWSAQGEKIRTEIFDRYDPMMRAFAEFVRGDRENPYTCDYELELYKLILKSCEIKGENYESNTY